MFSSASTGANCNPSSLGLHLMHIQQHQALIAGVKSTAPPPSTLSTLLPHHQPGHGRAPPPSSPFSHASPHPPMPTADGRLSASLASTWVDDYRHSVPPPITAAPFPPSFPSPFPSAQPLPPPPPPPAAHRLGHSLAESWLQQYQRCMSSPSPHPPPAIPTLDVGEYTAALHHAPAPPPAPAAHATAQVPPHLPPSVLPSPSPAVLTPRLPWLSSPLPVLPRTQWTAPGPPSTLAPSRSSPIHRSVVGPPALVHVPSAAASSTAAVHSPSAVHVADARRLLSVVEVERRGHEEEAERQWRALYRDEHELDEEEVGACFLSDASWAAGAGEQREVEGRTEQQGKQPSVAGVSDFIRAAMEGHTNPWEREEGGGEWKGSIAEAKPRREAAARDEGDERRLGKARVAASNDGPLSVGAEWDSTGRAWDWVQRHLQVQHEEVEKAQQEGSGVMSDSYHAGDLDSEWAALYR